MLLKVKDSHYTSYGRSPSTIQCRKEGIKRVEEKIIFNDSSSLNSYSRSHKLRNADRHCTVFLTNCVSECGGREKKGSHRHGPRKFFMEILTRQISWRLTFGGNPFKSIVAVTNSSFRVSSPYHQTCALFSHEPPSSIAFSSPGH